MYNIWYMKLKYKHCQSCKCEENLLINSSRINKKGELKHSYICKDCQSERTRKYRTTEKGKEVYREIMRRQYQQHKEKVMARQAVNYAIRKGMLTKPYICEHCKEVKKLDGHHEDYKKPLLVNWLCRKCHSIV